MNHLTGDSIITSKYYTRGEAGKLLTPPLSERHIREYIKLAVLFLPGWEDFGNPEGGILPKKLEPIHIPPLQALRDLVAQKGSFALAREHLARLKGQYDNQD